LVLLITLPLNYPFWASQRAGRVVEYLPGKCEVLSSKPQYHKRKKKKTMMFCAGKGKILLA
jgi:hypothetical protein